MKQTLNTEQKTLKFSDFEALNEQELRETEGGLRIKILGLTVVERDGTRDKGHRWRWGWQKEW